MALPMTEYVRELDSYRALEEAQRRCLLVAKACEAVKRALEGLDVR